MRELTDTQWLEVVLGVSILPEFSGRKIFGVPDDQMQISTVGRAGDIVFRSVYEFYIFLKNMLEQHGRGIRPDTSILDFGCGWGRIIRFWRKDFDPHLTFGVDVQESLLAIARRHVPDCVFSNINSHPPTSFLADQFDLIYAYSVFSHIPEDMCGQWIKEFSRILKPGGLACVTTRPREHIVAVHSKQHPDKTAHTDMYAKIIADPETALKLYDAGEFIHYPAASGALKQSEWGETMISANYARRRFSNDLEVIGFFQGYSKSYLQPAIVMRKRH